MLEHADYLAVLAFAQGERDPGVAALLALENSADRAIGRASDRNPLFESGEAIGGLNIVWLAGLLAGAGLGLALAWYCFERRDIRVAGEGVWRWPFFRKRRPA